MKKSFLIQFKRRREEKTNYRKRIGLLKSNKTRLVIRRSLSNITVQFVDFVPSGDKTIVTATSSELKKMGWNRTGNIPASYLTGLLAGKKAKDKKIEEAILDLGLQISTKGSRIYAALKGVLDSGIKVPYSEEILPSEDRIKGKHISKDLEKQFEEVKSKIVG
ncbi:50S ribosomal protein L18 [Candidatus Micrarchaeota archaeon RBG_16_36_9]|nr:large subunit ribosomal protein L18 [uncultured archaeon]OGI11948.1 MAG: 50S ribosomal protein L18 [Candidatus Micrarchaeota archaeon RBG_16_36_9]